jgi:hypothetical protein
VFDVNTLTLGEIAKVEQLSGQPIVSIGDQAAPKGAALAALAMVIKRRTGDPRFSWDAAQNLTMAEAMEIVGLDDDDLKAAQASDEDGDKSEEGKARPPAPRTRRK